TGSARRREADAADADGGRAAALSRAARGDARLARGDSRVGLGPARRYTDPRDRQLHRASAALHRGRSRRAAASADHPRRRLPVRRESEMSAEALKAASLISLAYAPIAWRAPARTDRPTSRRLPGSSR